MAQNTGAISSKDYKIEVSVDGTNWLDHSGTATKITPAAGERMTGETHTFDGDTPIVTGGKRAAKTLNVEFVYSEGASDLYEVVRTAYEAGTPFYIRYAPKNGQSGEFRFTSDPGIIQNLVGPAGDAGSGEAVVCSFDLITPKTTKAVV